MDKIRVLIVEDEVELRDVFVDACTVQGFEAVASVNGEEALELLLDESIEPFDAILSDICMPKLDGLSLLASLREKEVWVPFVFLTGYADKEKAIRALKLGAFDFLEKPFKTASVISILTSAAKFGRLLRTLNDEVESRVSELGIESEEEREAVKDAVRQVLMLSKQRIAMSKAG